MNPKLLKTMPQEIQVLWELSKKKKLNRDFDRLVRDNIRRKRSEISDNAGHDSLEYKAERFKKPGSWGLRKIQELSQALYQDKRPEEIDLGEWVSLEIECIFPEAYAESAFVAFIRKNGFGKYVTIKNDGSIHPDREECPGHSDDDGNDLECDCEGRESFGKEIVVTMKYGQWDMLKAICKSLTGLGCTVNRTCGLHVHFDCRHLNPRQAGTLGKRVALTIPALKQLLPKSRQDNEFCQVDINRIDGRGGDGRHARYAFVNMMAYDRHKTIEIRGHSGTLDALKMVNWIRLIRTIMEKRNTKPVATVSELINAFKLDNDLAAYVVTRYEKFSQENRKPRREQPADDVSADQDASIDEVSLNVSDEELTRMVQRVAELTQGVAHADPRPGAYQAGVTIQGDMHSPSQDLNVTLEYIQRSLSRPMRWEIRHDGQATVVVDSMSPESESDEESA